MEKGNRFLSFAVLSAFVCACAFSVRAAAEERQPSPKPLKVLAIGNSFSSNVPSGLTSVARDCGMVVDAAALFIGGCTLERHAACLEKAEKDPTSRPYGIPYSYMSCKNAESPVARLLNDGATNRLEKGKAHKANLPEMLKADRWDIVSIQQGSSASWNYETYRPHADRVIAAIRKYAPQAEIVIQETWSYNADHYSIGGNGKHGKGAKRWGFDQKGMYDRLHAAYAKLSSDFGGLRIIPVGTAVQAYRTANPALPDLAGRPGSSDLIHLNAAGNYLQACTWARTLLGVDVSNVPCHANKVTPEIAAACRAAAMAATSTGPIPGSAARPCSSANSDRKKGE